MKVKNPRSRTIQFSDIAKFSSENSDMKLVDVINDATKEVYKNDFLDTPGAFVYELDLALDAVRTYYLDMESFDIEFYRNNPIRKRSIKREPRRKKAKSKRQRQRQFIQSTELPFFSFRTPLGVELPNPNIQYIVPPPPPPPQENRVLFYDKPETQGPLAPALITAEPIRAPDASTADATAGSNGTIWAPGVAGKTPAPESASKSNESPLFKSHEEQAVEKLKNDEDPMGAVQKAKPNNPILATKAGVGSPLDTPPFLEPAEMVALENIRVRNSMVETRAGSFDQNEDYSKAAYALANALSGYRQPPPNRAVILGYMATVRNTKKRIRRRIEIPKYLLNGRKRFFVKITPTARTKKNTVKWTSTTVPFVFAVNHADKVRSLFTPQAPPEVSLIKNQRGYIVLRVQQKDPAGSSITVVRRIFSPRNKDKMSVSVPIADVETGNGASSHVIIDSDVANIDPNKVIYRVITRGPTGLLGPSTGLVVGGIPSIVVPPAMSDPNHLSIVAKNEEGAVEIRVAYFPESVLSMSLLREDLGRAGDFSDRVTVVPTVDNKTKVMVPSTGELLFTDVHTVPGRSYRYFAKMLPRFGPEFLSEEEEPIIRLVPTEPLPVSVSITGATVTRTTAGKLTAEMGLISVPQNDNIDFVLNLLRSSGVSEVFITEIDRQRSNFADLAVFLVERVNRVTGRRESFGFQPPGVFRDDTSTRAANNVSPLQPDTRYTYFAKVCIRPPEALMRSVFTTFSGPQTPGIDDKEALAQKFLSAYASQFGNSPGGALPSVADLVNGISITDNLRAGDTGIVLEANVTIPAAKPRPTNLTALRTPAMTPPGVILKWNATPGDISLIDYCVVLVNINGTKFVAGSTASDGSSTTFTFYEASFGFQPGTVAYTVKFVYRDMTPSEESNTVRFSNVSYTPPAFLEGNYTGVA